MSDQLIDSTPSAHLNADQLVAWTEIIDSANGTLAQSGRLAVELASCLIAKIRSGDARSSDFSNLSRALNQLGLTPISRRQVDPVAIKSDDENPFAQFL